MSFEQAMEDQKRRERKPPGPRNVCATGLPWSRRGERVEWWARDRSLSRRSGAGKPSCSHLLYVQYQHVTAGRAQTHHARPPAHTLIRFSDFNPLWRNAARRAHDCSCRLQQFPPGPGWPTASSRLSATEQRGDAREHRNSSFLRDKRSMRCGGGGASPIPKAESDRLGDQKQR